MNINKLLEEKGITKYRLSKLSKVPYTTINDLCNGRVKIEKCTAETLFKLSQVLGITMEAMVSEALEHRSSFEIFKSNVCHQVKDMGDLSFIIDVLETGKIRDYYNKNWYPEALYLLAMLDYLSRENELPLALEYDDIRSTRLHEPIFPASIIAMSAVSHSEEPKRESWEEAIPEFKRFNIVENEVRNVL
ncbi:MAG: helix-turn-helix domain-containing protein [Oscillospiraceae bacterium]|jgi:plasmid maintenance system antidote protein VapI|nr:helix-turn-helix domain-containing protein [Oscillospiraceae bacterium]